MATGHNNSNWSSGGGWMSAERRRLHGMSLAEGHESLHYSRSIQAHPFRRIPTATIGGSQSRRSLGFVPVANENRPYHAPVHHHPIEVQANCRKNTTRVGFTSNINQLPLLNCMIPNAFRCSPPSTQMRPPMALPTTERPTSSTSPAKLSRPLCTLFRWVLPLLLQSYEQRLIAPLFKWQMNSA